jgi:hypothetical protein
MSAEYSTAHFLFGFGGNQGYPLVTDLLVRDMGQTEPSDV